MDILTVTCLRDLNDFLLQAESIQRFVKNKCRHIVYVNEPKDQLDKKFWETKLKPYYTKHDLLLVFPEFNTYAPNSDSGYIKQQFYKLEAAKYFTKKYLVLDSKNFFVKPCETTMWESQIGSGIIAEINTNDFWYPVFNTYAEKLQITEKLTKFWAIQTPFVIDPAVISDIKTTLDMFFVENAGLYSEFIFYSLLGHKKRFFNLHNAKTQNLKHKCVFGEWDVTQLDDYLTFMQSLENEVYIVGFHRYFLNKCSDEQLDKINIWISELDLTNRVKRNDRP